MALLSKKEGYLVFGLLLENAVGFYSYMFFGEMTSLLTTLSLQGILGLIAFIALIICPIAIFALYRSSKSTNKVEQHFAHLTVHTCPKGQKYISNNLKGGKTYWLSEIFKSEMAENRLSKHQHK